MSAKVCGTCGKAIYRAARATGWDHVAWDDSHHDVLPAECCGQETFSPNHDGSPRCQSGSLASGGTHAHCTCDTCF